MRFAAVPSQQPPQQRKSAAAEFVRRLVSAQAARPQPAPARAEDLPAELDQRVRLVGEW